MPAETTTARRVVDPATPTRARRLPLGWLRAGAAGAEAAILAWLTAVVPAIATYVSTAAAPALGEASWMAAAGAGTGVWLLGHGAALTAGTATVTLTPLGLTLLGALLVHASARRMRVDSYGAGGFTVAGYTLMVLLLGLLGPTAPWAALPGAVLVAGLGALPAVRRNRAAGPRWWARLRRRTPGWAEAGVRAAGGALLAALGCATALAALAVVRGLPRVGELHDTLAGDPVSAVVLVLAQLAWLPTVVVWALTWLAGPGFVVGSGTSFAPHLTTTAPMPAVPVLGALPAPGPSGHEWVVVVPLLVGAGAGLYLHRRRQQPTLHAAVLSAAVMAVTAALGSALLVLLASGSIGAGRMTEVGAAAPTVAAAVFAELGAGALVVVVALHPRTRAVLGWVLRPGRSADEDPAASR